MLLGSCLGNHDGDTEDNVDWKGNLSFTYESGDTLKSFFFVHNCQNYRKRKSGTRLYISKKKKENIK